jgi:hypothetical protein
MTREDIMSNLYRKRPVVIEAMQWTGENINAIWDWANTEDVAFVGSQYSDELEIRTLEDGRDGQAKHVASLNDWIIRGVQGELYACKDLIFRQTYEPVEDAQ